MSEIIYQGIATGLTVGLLSLVLLAPFSALHRSISSL